MKYPILSPEWKRRHGFSNIYGPEWRKPSIQSLRGRALENAKRKYFVDMEAIGGTS